MNSVICCVFTKTKIILILFCLFIAGCVITKVPQQDFLGDNNDSLFISDYVSSNKVDGIIRCLGYRNDGYQMLDERSGEDVKRIGLILPAKSVLSSSKKLRAVFGNEIDSCILLYNLTASDTRNGRSALISVLNLVSNIKD